MGLELQICRHYMSRAERNVNQIHEQKGCRMEKEGPTLFGKVFSKFQYAEILTSWLSSSRLNKVYRLARDNHGRTETKACELAACSWCISHERRQRQYPVRRQGTRSQKACELLFQERDSQGFKDQNTDGEDRRL